MDDSDLAIYAVKFSEQVRTFIALFGQLEDLTDKPVWPGYPRGLVRSLYLLGGTTQTGGNTSQTTVFSATTSGDFDANIPAAAERMCFHSLSTAEI